MWFVRKSRYLATEAELIEVKAELAALQVHCETLQAEIDLMLTQLKETQAEKEKAEAALRSQKPAVVKRSSRKKLSGN